MQYKERYSRKLEKEVDNLVVSPDDALDCLKYLECICAEAASRLDTPGLGNPWGILAKEVGKAHAKANAKLMQRTHWGG